MDKEKFKILVQTALYRMSSINHLVPDDDGLPYMAKQVQRHKYDHTLCCNRSEMEVWYAEMAEQVRWMIRPLDQKAFIELLTFKHERYGVEPLIAWGPISILIKIDSKVSRLKNLIANDLPVGDENVDDTLKDILGYCVLGYLITTQQLEA